MLKVFLVVTLAVSLAQIVPSCGDQEAGGALVVGVVEGKRIDQDKSFVITVLGTEYEVPAGFWQEVKVGDLVRWDGKVWTIVRRAGT